METLLGFFVLLFGAIIGSFLNVVAFRINTGRTLGGRSQCFVCSTKLKWYELLPIVSYVVQHGKCTNCSSKISMQYPIVESITAFLFIVIGHFETAGFAVITQSTILSMFFYWTVASILIVISVYDLKHKIIPDSLSYTFSILALGKLILMYGSALFSTELLALLAGPILFVPFFLLWYFSKGEWMGFGDAKLALGIGWLLGLANGISAIILGFWIGTAVMVLVLIYQHFMHHRRRRDNKKYTEEGLGLKSEIPFAPFLILGTLVAYVCNLDIMSIGVLLTLFGYIEA